MEVLRKTEQMQFGDPCRQRRNMFQLDLNPVLQESLTLFLDFESGSVIIDCFMSSLIFAS